MQPGKSKTPLLHEWNLCPWPSLCVLLLLLLGPLMTKRPWTAFGWPFISCCAQESTLTPRAMPSILFELRMSNSRLAIDITMMSPPADLFYSPLPRLFPSPSPHRRMVLKVKSWHMPPTGKFTLARPVPCSDECPILCPMELLIPCRSMCIYTDSGDCRCVSSSMITRLLRAAALSIPGHAGVNPANIAARSLRSSGTMALLLSSVDPDNI